MYWKMREREVTAVSGVREICAMKGEGWVFKRMARSSTVNSEAVHQIAESNLCKSTRHL